MVSLISCLLTAAHEANSVVQRPRRNRRQTGLLKLKFQDDELLLQKINDRLTSNPSCAHFRDSNFLNACLTKTRTEIISRVTVHMHI